MMFKQDGQVIPLFKNRYAADHRLSQPGNAKPSSRFDLGEAIASNRAEIQGMVRSISTSPDRGPFGLVPDYDDSGVALAEAGPR
jgi:hypothetical protein